MNRRKKRKANLVGDSDWVLQLMIKRMKSVPHKIGIGEKPWKTGNGCMAFIPGRDLIITGRTQSDIHVIPLTIDGWKQLRGVCRQAIKMIKDEQSKSKKI